MSGTRNDAKTSERKNSSRAFENAGSIKIITTVAEMRINEIFNIRQPELVEHEKRGRERKALQMSTG